MTPLASLVITVAPEKAVTTPGHLGRAVYRFWLDYIATHSPKIAEQLHEQTQYKPFTCSTLVGGERKDRNSRLYLPEKPAWFRLTALTPSLVEILEEMVEQPPTHISLDNTPFAVQNVTFNSDVHPWAGRTTYQDLFSRFLGPSSKHPHRIGIEFASATGFRFSPSPNKSSRTWPVPMPNWVFGNLLRHWQSYSPDKFLDSHNKAFFEFVNNSLVLTRYKLETRAIPFKDNIPHMGCVGEAHYILIEQDRYWQGTLHLLTAFAFYAGIGYQTTIGMGQTRFLPPYSKK